MRTTNSYAAAPPFGEPIEQLANGRSLDEQRHRERGTADLVDEHGVVFGVAIWRAELSRWYAQSAVGGVRTRGETVDEVSKRLRRKMEERR